MYVVKRLLRSPSFVEILGRYPHLSQTPEGLICDEVFG